MTPSAAPVRRRPGAHPVSAATGPGIDMLVASPDEIINEARNGRMFILVDDEDRENEGDLIIPAQMATPEKINFMATHGRGLICLAMTRERIDALGLPLMSRINGTKHETAFTVSIEAREGVTTGISTADRACTVAVAIDSMRGSDAIVTPGHVFPLMARDGGVLVRAGHTEAAVDVARLAGLNPSGVICEIMNEDGTMARLDQLLSFAERHDLKIGTIRDLISYRRRFDRVVERVESKAFDSAYGGEWRLLTYRSKVDGAETLVLQKGEVSPYRETLVRMHTASLLSDLLGEQGSRTRAVPQAMEQIARAGAGIIVLIVPRTEGGVPLPASRDADPDIDPRSYGVGAEILADMGVHDMVLLTGSPSPQLVGLEAFGLRIVRQQPFDFPK